MPATPSWPPRSAPRLFVPGPLAAGGTVTVEGNQAHYLAKVMRMAEGEAVVLCDDVTGEWAARVVASGKRAVELETVEKLRNREEVPDFWLCPALLKKDRFDLVLEKATELGVRAIHPVVTRRCVADKLNLERAQAIVTEAAEQCARTALPRLAEPTKLHALLSDWPAERALFFADELGGAPRRRLRRCRARGYRGASLGAGRFARAAHPAGRDRGDRRRGVVDERGGRLVAARLGNDSKRKRLAPCRNLP